MSIQPVSSVNNTNLFNKYKYDFVKYTGYGALASGVLCVTQAVRHKPKSHKYLGILSGILALAHVGLIEYIHSFSHKNQ